MSEFILSKMTPFDLDRIVDNFQQRLDYWDESSAEAGAIWAQQKEIAVLFREVRFQNREEYQNAWSRFQSLISLFREKKEFVKGKHEQFAQDTNRRLDHFEQSIGGGLLAPDRSKDDFTMLFEEQKALYELIRQPKWPSREARDRAWDRYNSLRDKLKSLQQESFAKAQAKWNERLAHSKQIRDNVLRMINACSPEASIDLLLEEVGRITLFLVTLGFSEIFFNLMGGGPGEKPASPLKQKSRALNDVRKYIKENGARLTKEDKSIVYDELNQVQESLNIAWESYREESDRKQREFCAKVEQNLANQIAYLEKQRDYETTQRDRINKLEGIKDKQNAYLTKLHDQLDDLRDKRRDAYSDSFRERVDEWIEGKEAKINEVEASIDELNEKITVAESKCRELPAKIAELEHNIEDLRMKLHSCRGR